MQKEELKVQKRLIELSSIAYQRGIVTYSDFLNLNELNILHTTPGNLFSSTFETNGGYGFSERQMAAFLPDALYLREYGLEPDYPITALRIRPLHKKFAESLSHRDYLGAILNLGIDRSKLGDILTEDSEAIVFVQSKLAPFLCEQLVRVRHTEVRTEMEAYTGNAFKPRIEEITGTVASVRLDSLLSLAFRSSRTKLSGLIEGAKVFVNGRLITTNAYQVKEGDIVSVRGMGRFSYQGTLSQTKKGRYYVCIQKYI